MQNIDRVNEFLNEYRDELKIVFPNGMTRTQSEFLKTLLQDDKLFEQISNIGDLTLVFKIAVKYSKFVRTKDTKEKIIK